MKKIFVLCSTVFIFVFSLHVNAQNSGKAIPEGLIDYAIPPETIADSIVIYIPSKNMQLHKPETVDRVIEGRTARIEKGVQPNVIIHTANTIVVPLEAGVPMRLFLKKFPDKDAYYPIAIFPLSAGEKL